MTNLCILDECHPSNGIVVTDGSQGNLSYVWHWQFASKFKIYCGHICGNNIVQPNETYISY